MIKQLDSSEQITASLERIAPGSLVVFNNDFKQQILDDPTRDWLFYIRDNVFEVNEISGDTISIKGIHVLGFKPISMFNKY